GTGLPRVKVTTDNDPHGGSHHVTLASGAEGVVTRNELTLALDLAGYTNVVLRFWAKEFNEAPDGPPPIPFTDAATFDGEAISADGVEWYEVQGLRTLGEFYSDIVVDLDAALARFGLSYNAAFRLRFNQYGNHALTNNGIALDDMEITGQAPTHFALTL